VTLVTAMTERTIKGRDLSRGERLQIMLDADELQALDDFRFSHRMPSRAAAVRELLRRGLASEAFEPSNAAAKSGAYGVISAPPQSHNGSGDGSEGAV
jgi:metal-responsive CopG/Arc/MetJ family transcriptional regulator